MGLVPSTAERFGESKNSHRQGQEVGFLGELIAKQFLQEKKYVFLENNWTCKLGELDLIFREKNTLVFVEVKTRMDSSLAAKNIFNNITYKKKKKLRQLAQIYLFKNFRDNARPPYRIDVIGVILSRDRLEAIKIEHLKNAIGDVSY